MLSSTLPKIIKGFTETLSSVGAGVAKGLSLEGGRGSELEPLFSGERIDNFLLLPLLTIVFLAFSLSHDYGELTFINIQFNISLKLI